MTNPFYSTLDYGVGVMFDGTCGFIEEIKDFDRTSDQSKMTDVRTLSIYPLEHNQEIGEYDESNHVVKDKGHIELSFASKESIDVLIQALNQLKEM